MTEWIKVTSTQNVTCPQGYTMVQISRHDYVLDGVTARGWQLYFINQRTQAWTYSVYGTVDNPILVLVYPDNGNAEDKYISFINKDGNFSCVVNGLSPSSGSGAYNSFWLPERDYDFTPLFIKYGNG